MCKNTFVWVRCPFFGDYINPDSFMQDLNTESKVKFSEIILGKYYTVSVERMLYHE